MNNDLPEFWLEDYEKLSQADLAQIAFQMQALILLQEDQIKTMSLLITELKAANQLLREML